MNFSQRITRRLGEDFVFAVSSKSVNGNLSFRYAQVNGQTVADVAAARYEFLKTHSIDPGRVVVPQLVHGSHVLVAGNHLGEGVSTPPTDVLSADIFVSQDNEYIGMAVADCAVIAFAAPGHRRVVSAHIGWRSLDKSVLEVIREEVLAAGLPINELVTVIGPAQKVAVMETIGTDLQKHTWEKYIDRLESGVFNVHIGLRLMNDLGKLGLCKYPIVCEHDPYTDQSLWSHARTIKSKGTEPEGRTLIVVGYRAPIT